MRIVFLIIAAFCFGMALGVYIGSGFELEVKDSMDIDNTKMRIGQINAVICATEEVIKRPAIDKGTMLMAKETAYDNIRSILAGKCPWQDETNTERKVKE